MDIASHAVGCGERAYRMGRTALRPQEAKTQDLQPCPDEYSTGAYKWAACPTCFITFFLLKYFVYLVASVFILAKFFNSYCYFNISSICSCSCWFFALLLAAVVCYSVSFVFFFCFVVALLLSFPVCVVQVLSTSKYIFSISCLAGFCSVIVLGRWSHSGAAPAQGGDYSLSLTQLLQLQLEFNVEHSYCGQNVAFLCLGGGWLREKK